MTRLNGATFTGRRNDWLRCVAFDHQQIQPFDFKVAYVIAMHINEDTGKWILTDNAIVEEAGGSARNVRYSRTRLREAGWLAWRRTRRGAEYRLLFRRVPAVMEQIAAMRAHRKARKAAARRSSDRQPVAVLNCGETW
jgi:hypothetical protein